MNYDIVVENKIKEAIDSGLFDDLPGQGRPLNLHENLHEPAVWRLAYKMLHDHGFTLPWIAERKEIEEALEGALKRLAQAGRDAHPTRPPDVWARADWQKAQNWFREAVTKLNRRIRDYNLQAPHVAVQRALVDGEAELGRAERGAASAGMWKAAGE